VKIRYFLIAAAFLFLVTGPVRAGSAPHPDEFLSRLQSAVEGGELSADEALLCRFQYLFDPGQLPQEWRIAEPAPLKCGSSLVREFQEMSGDLHDDLAAKISDYLEPLQTQAAVTSASGRFQLTYSLTGEHAVSALDIDPPNGIPDFVERVAGYLDHAWETEIVGGGFTAPVSVGGPYTVSFQAMAAYGYTVVENPVAGATRIVMHNNFEDFPPNDDPEGDRWGAAKVTAAHELKHASQYAASRWSEGGWIELDAVWAEELVCDEVNDYYHFLTGESPLRRPDLSLDFGGSGSYEDVVFQIWMEQIWGVAIIRDFWSQRQSDESATVMETWEQLLVDRGTSLAAAWAQFTAWNYGTDLRATPAIGYEEAKEYPCGSADAVQIDTFVSRSGLVEHLAAHTFRLDGFRELAFGPEDRLEIELLGASQTDPLTLAVHITRRDGSGRVETCSMDWGAGVRHLLSVPCGEILTVGIAVGNAAISGPARPFDLTMAVVNAAQRVPVLLDPAALEAELNAGSATSRAVTIACDAGVGAALDFEIEICSADPRTDSAQFDPHVDVSPWLGCFPMSGGLEPGAEAPLTLEFSSVGLAADSYQCWLAIHAEGFSDPVVIPVTLEVVDARSPGDHDGRLLIGSHPNPFNPVTQIHFALPAAAAVQIDVLDVRGHVVCNLLNQWHQAGSYSVEWNGRNETGAPLGAGIYLARLQTGGRSFTCKMVLAK
jgi:FlgD Ig-like domain